MKEAREISSNVKESNKVDIAKIRELTQIEIRWKEYETELTSLLKPLPEKLRPQIIKLIHAVYDKAYITALVDSTVSLGSEKNRKIALFDELVDAFELVIARIEIPIKDLPSHEILKNILAKAKALQVKGD